MLLLILQLACQGVDHAGTPIAASHPDMPEGEEGSPIDGRAVSDYLRLTFLDDGVVAYVEPMLEEDNAETYDAYSRNHAAGAGTSSGGEGPLGIDSTALWVSSEVGNTGYGYTTLRNNTANAMTITASVSGTDFALVEPGTVGEDGGLVSAPSIVFELTRDGFVPLMVAFSPLYLNVETATEDQWSGMLYEERIAWVEIVATTGEAAGEIRGTMLAFGYVFCSPGRDEDCDHRDEQDTGTDTGEDTGEEAGDEPPV